MRLLNGSIGPNLDKVCFLFPNLGQVPEIRTQWVNVLQRAAPSQDPARG